MTRRIGPWFVMFAAACGPAAANPRNVPIAPGWAATKINAVIFRHDSVTSHDGEQYVAFYDPDARVVLAKRRLGSDQWEIRPTPYRGNVRDSHNTISIMVDGDGFLHMSWDHHCHPLHYCRSTEPGSLEMTDPMPMIGRNEGVVTYPEFHRFADGDLLFLYRDGSSGNGDLVLNRYDRKTREWSRVQTALIDGEGARNAYWQACLDRNGGLHLSWVWRETPDVMTNHDIAYAVSPDEGRTWQRSDGTAYELPINLANAEYARRIPQNSGLMNQTSMCVDGRGRPYIATYWRPEGTEVPQYHCVYRAEDGWKTTQIGSRTGAFSLKGLGTRVPPISRPRIVAATRDGVDKAWMVFRDADRGGLVSVAICDDLPSQSWRFQDLTDYPVGRWEPTCDSQLWKEHGVMHLFLQRVGQGAGDTLEDIGSSEASILEWTPGEGTPAHENR